MGAPLFDRIVTVDWSARATPAQGPDSVWVATLDAGSTDPPRLANPATRAQAAAHLHAVLRPAQRVLLAIDVGLGWPAGTTDALGLAVPPGGSPWAVHAAALATAVVDGPDNANNRFVVAAARNAAISDGPGPWWGCPPAAATAALAPTRAPGFPHRTRQGADLAEWRHAERVLRAEGHQLSSVWQLLGRGSVGSQSLLGLAALVRLAQDPAWAARWRWWPCTTGFGDDPTGGRPDAVVVAEAWPSLVALHPMVGLVRDAAQVWALAAALEQLDRHGALAPLFAPVLDPAVAAVAEAEEGWVLGAGTPLAARGARVVSS